MKKNRIPSEADRRTIRAGHRYGALVLTMLACAALTCPALAADDPLTIVGTLSDFIFSIIKALVLSSSAGALCRWVCLSSPMTPASGRRAFCASLGDL